MPDKTRVLVVEDNEYDRALLQVHLREDEFAADFASDGVEAWALLEQRADRYDLVLLDRTMPRMNGLELLGRMKRDARCRTIPVILQTACVGREEMITKKVDIHFQRNGDEIHFHIRDEGNGFEWKRYLDIDPRRAFDTHGRGILLARHFSFTALEYRGRGNEVTATVSLAGALA